MNHGQLWHLLRDLGFDRTVLNRGLSSSCVECILTKKGKKLAAFLYPLRRATVKVPDGYVVATRFQLDHRGLLPRRLWDKRVAKYNGVKTYR
jgi:hypothetical protein